MKTKLIFIAFLFLSISMSAQWKPAGDKIKTAWAETLNLDNKQTGILKMKIKSK